TRVYRIVVADNRLYIVFAGGRDGAETSPQVRRFLDSFHITDPILLAKGAERKQKKDQADARKRQEEAAERKRQEDADREADRQRQAAAEQAEFGAASVLGVGHALADALWREEAARRARAEQLAEQVGAAADRQWANTRPQPEPVPVAPPPR